MLLWNILAPMGKNPIFYSSKTEMNDRPVSDVGGYDESLCS